MIEFIEKLVSGSDLSGDEAGALVKAMTEPNAASAQIGAALAALRAKGESSVELCGFARALLAQSIRVPIDCESAVDIVGTGGDGSHSVNISTGAALLAAACGVPVVKHGNRAVSGRSGSADVLESLGYVIPDSAEKASDAFDATGFTFLYAPQFHPALSALRHARRALGIRTVFNVLGPLINPARPPFAVIGAPTLSLAQLMADAVASMHFQRVFIVHGANNWDEPTPLGPFVLLDVRGKHVASSQRDPLDVGMQRCSVDDLKGGEPCENAAKLRSVFAGECGAHRDALALSAGLALEVSGAASDFEHGVSHAREALDQGLAERLLSRITSEQEAMRHGSK